MNERKMIYLDDAIGVLEERLQANGYSNIALVSELNRSIGYLMQLPPAQPERKKGRWFFSDTDFLTHCSNCGQSEWKGYCPTPKEATERMPICPNCGADMRGAKHE